MLGADRAGHVVTREGNERWTGVRGTDRTWVLEIDGNGTARHSEVRAEAGVATLTIDVPGERIRG